VQNALHSPPPASLNQTPSPSHSFNSFNSPFLRPITQSFSLSLPQPSITQHINKYIYLTLLSSAPSSLFFSSLLFSPFPQSNNLFLLPVTPHHPHGRCSRCSHNARRLRGSGRGISTSSAGRGVRTSGGAKPLRIAEAAGLEHVLAVPAEPQAAIDVGAVQWGARDRVSQVPRPVRED